QFNIQSESQISKLKKKGRAVIQIPPGFRNVILKGSVSYDFPEDCFLQEELIMQHRFLRLIIVIVIFIVLSSGISHAGEVFVNLSKNGMFAKKVESWKEKRMKKMVPQAYDFSCGAAVVATVMKYYFGNQITEKDAILGMIKNGDINELRQRGFSLLDMKRYVESIHYEAGGFQIPKIQILQRLPMPLIALIKTQHYNHFVVIRYVDDNYVYLADPSWGNRRLSLTNFDEAWSPKVIFAIAGPVIGSPEGLYRETNNSNMAVFETLRSGPKGVAGYHVPTDPSQTMFNRYNGSMLPLPFISGGRLLR
ncbi:MAG: C39 family peptidase, partial [Smithella sp.]